MYNLKLIEKIKKCFLLISNINGIDFIYGYYRNIVFSSCFLSCLSYFIKKYFMCKTISYLLTNHIKQEYNDLKKKFNDYYS